MKPFLKSLQEKSNAAKEQVAFFGALAITGIIATFWIVSLPQQLAARPVSNEAAQVSAVEREGAFSQFFKGAKAQLAAVLASAPLATTTASSTSPATTTNNAIIIPTLSTEEARRLNPTPILIGTTSASIVEGE